MTRAHHVLTDPKAPAMIGGTKSALHFDHWGVATTSETGTAATVYRDQRYWDPSIWDARPLLSHHQDDHQNFTFVRRLRKLGSKTTQTKEMETSWSILTLESGPAFCVIYNHIPHSRFNNINELTSLQSLAAWKWMCLHIQHAHFSGSKKGLRWRSNLT